MGGKRAGQNLVMVTGIVSLGYIVLRASLKTLIKNHMTGTAESENKVMMDIMPAIDSTQLVLISGFSGSVTLIRALMMYYNNYKFPDRVRVYMISAVIFTSICGYIFLYQKWSFMLVNDTAVRMKQRTDKMISGAGSKYATQRKKLLY